jgi:hypothetical protein
LGATVIKFNKSIPDHIIKFGHLTVANLPNFSTETMLQLSELVLPIYESMFPEEGGPRQAIAAARRYMADRTEDNWIASGQAAANVVKSIHSASNTSLNNPNIKPDDYWDAYHAAIATYHAVLATYYTASGSYLDMYRANTAASWAAKSIRIKQHKIKIRDNKLNVMKLNSWVQLC